MGMALSGSPLEADGRLACRWFREASMEGAGVAHHLTIPSELSWSVLSSGWWWDDVISDRTNAIAGALPGTEG